MNIESTKTPGSRHVLIGLVGHFVLLTALFAQTIMTVEGQGDGMTKDAALTAAKRDAVEKGIGVVNGSETQVKDFIVARDQIVAKSSGFIKTYKEISSSQGPDGLWTLRISAVVTDILDELVKDQLAMDLLLAYVRHPRFMIMLDETNIDDANSTVASTEVGRLLASKGFDIISPEQSSALRQRNIDLATLTGDANLAAGLAAEFGAEYLIIGQATSRTIPVPIPGTIRLSGQANITAKVVRADDGRIIAQETFHGKSTHIEALTAGSIALKKAGAKLAEYLMAETVRRWSTEQSNSRNITVKISGLNFRGRSDMINFLNNEVNGVKSVDQRSFAAGVVVLAVKFGGSNDDFGFQLDGKDLGNFIISITGMSPNSIDLEARAK